MNRTGKTGYPVTFFCPDTLFPVRDTAIMETEAVLHIMKNIILLLYLIVSALHLQASYEDDAEKRKKTKPFLLLFLLAFYLCAAKDPDFSRDFSFHFAVGMPF